MWNFKRTFQEAFDTGGLLIFGLGCLFLFRQQYYPSVLGPLSFGMISVVALGFVRHLVKDLGSESIESSKHEEILLLLEQRQSEIAANRCMLEELREACSQFMAMREILEAWQADPSLIQEQAANLAKILQPRDGATSRESPQETPSDVQLEPLAGGSPTESGNRALSEDVGQTKLDVQPEQTAKSPKTLKEQALQVHSNISASLQCHATENHLKEDSKKQHLEITDESKQDPENNREKVTEKDMKQEDRVLKGMEKTGYDGIEYKPKEIENLAKNDVQPEEKEELQMKESDELLPQEERSEDIAPKEMQRAKEESEDEFLKEIEQVIPEI